MAFNGSRPALGRGGTAGRGGRGRGFSGAGQKRQATPFMSGALKVVKENVHRFLIPNDIVRKVIGKGGENIKSVLATTKEVDAEAKVFIVQQYSDGSPLMEGAADRVLTVQATLEGLGAALGCLLMSIQREEAENKKKEIRMMIPIHVVSAVIGRKGETVKRIRQETKSFIQTYTDELPNSNEVIVRMQNFEPNDLIETVKKVVEVIAEHKSANPVKFYEPIYFAHCEYGNTGSFVDTDYYQEAIRCGQIISPYSGKKKKTDLTAQGCAQQWGADAYSAAETAADYSQTAYGQAAYNGYDEWGAAYQADSSEWASGSAYGQWETSYDYGNGYTAEVSYGYEATKQSSAPAAAANGGYGAAPTRGRGRGMRRPMRSRGGF